MQQWYRSKTVWFNVITFVLAVLALNDVTSLLPIAATKYIAAVNAVGNLVLRMFFTAVPLNTATEGAKEKAALFSSRL